MKINKPKIVFFGTPEFAIPILDALRNNKLTPQLIITTPDKPKGRKMEISPPPVKIWAKKHNIAFLQPKTLKNPEIINELKNLNPDLFVIASYGKILPKDILDIPKYGTLNVHPSLLPRWRGPSPIQYTILAGDKETGVTIMLTDEEMDHGPILAQQKLKNYESGIMNYEELHHELAKLGAKLLIETIPKWVGGKIKPQEQDHSKATFSKIIKKQDGHINLQEETAEEIERKIKALNPWPGTYTFWQKDGKKIRLILLEAERTFPYDRKKVSGEVFEHNNKLTAQTKKGALLIKRLKPEGKKEMGSDNFLKGNQNILGKILL